ncbi:type III secretion system ATPase SctN (plasmid) [Pantoea sp. BJ2]|uniref:Flagellum-specific ATP synthase n=1 Tax=Pantoea sp. BJ2 TaxID=3141322 RepID=A0AAU7U3K0_9GAMM
MHRHDLLRQQAHPLKVAGAMIEARLHNVRIGEICDVCSSWDKASVVSRAVVLGFREDITVLGVIGSVQGLSRKMVISPTGEEFAVKVSSALIGSVLTPSGKVIERFCATYTHDDYEVRSAQSSPLPWNERSPISTPFLTGVRAIDGLIRCGRGQRMGIFAAAGCGKTTLMQMIINNADADIFVVALIGERGREVTEFVNELRASGYGHKCIVIYATSDFSALDRANAASVAMTVAEFFRDKGKNVVLFMDSVTRYARALRDIALMSGEPPARRGYPASVFERLPLLLERPGAASEGSITAFLTVLVENEEESDPVTEEIRSIIDGHIILSRKLAAKNHYPAIDVLKSISRVSQRVSSQNELLAAGKFRALMADIEELQVLIDFGEYQSGVNPEHDIAYKKKDLVGQFLCQNINEQCNENDMWNLMDEVVS